MANKLTSEKEGDESNRYQYNLTYIMLSEAWFNLSFISAIFILFFTSRGYTFQDIGFFELITSLTIVITDLPSGVLADRVGRKWVVFAANI